MRRRPQRLLAVDVLEHRHLLATAAPLGFTTTPVSASEVGLSWEFAADDTSGVVIERRTGPAGGFVTLAVLTAGETIFTDTGCWAGTSYEYRAKARGPLGDSTYTAAQSATTPGVGADAYAVMIGLNAVPRSPTSTLVSFVDANGGGASHLLERSDDGVSWTVVASLGTATTWQDSGLEPGKTFWYRGRDVGWSRPTSDYSAAVQVVMPNRPAAAPSEPVAVSATAVSATAIRLSWIAGDPSSTHYAIERATDYSPWHPPVWARIATTPVAATSFTDTGLQPETPYVYRVIAVRDGLESDPGQPASDVMHALFGAAVGAVTASAGRGVAQTYDIGPGRPLARLADLDWNALGPGDVVNIHATPGGYHELVQISCRGTAAAWITINGVPDPVTGALPIIDASDARLAPQFRNHYAPVHGSGAVVVGARPGFTHGYKPGYIEIRNLDIRNCHAAHRFTDVDGAAKNYGRVGAGIYLERCDHVTVSGCTIHDNGEGIFGAGQSGFDRVMTDITIDSNRIRGNGNVGSDREHNTYLEAVDVVYQFNRYGPLRSGALGAGLKDRSVGTVIRGNWIEGGAHQL
jgi:parallel beta-helix repeat protein